MATFQETLDECAFHAYERQMRVSAFVGDRDWLLDTEQATIKFGDDLVVNVQFLGTQSELTNTWVWANANDRVAFPPTSLELCSKARAHGLAVGIEEFGMDSFPFVDKVGAPTAHTLAMVAVAMSGASAYYRCPHEAGAVFVGIIDPRIDQLPALDREGFIKGFNSLMWLAGDMKKRIVSYLSATGCISKDWDGTELNCRLSTGEEIGFTFKPTPDDGMQIGLVSKRG